MIIIFIVMAGYGVASRSMVYYPKENDFTPASGVAVDTNFTARSIFRNIAYPVYYLMYGEFQTQLEDLDGMHMNIISNCKHISPFLKEHQDAGWSISTHILLAIHMLFVNILLTNLLIAMFR